MSGIFSRIFGSKDSRRHQNETKEHNREPRPSLPPSAIPKKEEEIRLPDYHFSGTLQTLWEEYRQAAKTPEQSAIQPLKETALAELSAAFGEKYASAPPDRNAEEYFYEVGHPAEFVTLLCKEFAVCTPRIGNELMEVFENVRALRHPFGLTLIQLLAVATKYRPNRINLTRAGFVKVVIDVAQTVCVRYQAVRQDSAIQSCEWAPQFHQYLLHMLLSVLRVCVNFTDPLETWKQDTVPAPRHSPLDGTGILHIVAGVLPTFHGRAASELLDFELQLLNALLGALAAFVHGNHVMQTAFNSCHGVDILLRFLGWPGNWRREQPEEGTEVANSKYYKEFELRLTCLRVLRCAVHDNGVILEAIEKSNGFDKIIEFILWVFMTCSEESSDIPDVQRQVDLTLAQANTDDSFKIEPLPLFRVLRDTPEFDRLFELLFAICALPLPRLDCFVLDAILGLFNKDETSTAKDQKGLLVKSPYNNLARRRMYFGHVKSGYGIRFPLLQQYTLHFFYRIIAIKPHLVRFVRDYAHITFFEQFFFFLGEMTDDQSEIPLTDVDNVLKSGVCRLLRLEVLQFLQFVATRDESPNLDECRFLMACLSQRWDEHELVSMVSRCATRILQASRPKTQICLLKASASKTLSRVIKFQRDLAKTESSEEFFRARVDVLDFLDEFLSTDNIKLQVLLEQDTVNIIFALIHEPPPMRNYGIKFVTELMVLVGQNFQLASTNSKLESDGKNVVQIDVDLTSNPGLCMEGLQDAQKTLFTQYVELLPQVMHDIDLVFELLAGIRNVVAVDPAYQDIFRKRQTFTHIVNFLSHLVPPDEDTSGGQRLDFAGSPPARNQHRTLHKSDSSLSVSGSSSNLASSAVPSTSASFACSSSSLLSGPVQVSRATSVFQSCVTPTVHSLSRAAYPFPSSFSSCSLSVPTSLAASFSNVANSPHAETSPTALAAQPCFSSSTASPSSASSLPSPSALPEASISRSSIQSELATTTITITPEPVNMAPAVTTTASTTTPVIFHFATSLSPSLPSESKGDYLSSPTVFPSESAPLPSPIFSPVDNGNAPISSTVTTIISPTSNSYTASHACRVSDTCLSSCFESAANTSDTSTVMLTNDPIVPLVTPPSSSVASMPPLSPMTIDGNAIPPSPFPSSLDTTITSAPLVMHINVPSTSPIDTGVTISPTLPESTGMNEDTGSPTLPPVLVSSHLSLVPLSIAATRSDAILPPLPQCCTPSDELIPPLPLLTEQLSLTLPPPVPHNELPSQQLQQPQVAKTLTRRRSSKFSFVATGNEGSTTRITPPSSPPSPRSFMSPSPVSTMMYTPRDSFVEQEHFSLGVSQYGRPKGKATREFGMTLCIEVLKTLSELMKGNKRVQDHFKQDIGYDYLGELLLRAEHSVPSRELFDSLFCMLLETDWVPPTEDTGAGYLIKNQGVLNLMFQLLSKCEPDHQLELLDTLTTIVSQCPLNQTICCKAHVIDSLLELFGTLQKTKDSIEGQRKLDALQKKVIDLIKLLGTYSISVKQLKRFFGLLKNQTVKLLGPSENDDLTPTIELRPTYGPQLLHAIEEMTQKEGPANYFYFDGVNSGLEIPPIEAWPIARGFSFSTWVRIESFASPSQLDPSVYQPRLFHFMTGGPNSFGLEAFFLDEQLTLEVTLKPNNPQAVTVVEYVFPTQKWFHLVITHSAPPTFGQKSELRVYVNGEQVHSSSTLKYPLITDQLNHCFIGTDEKDSTNALSGQLGPIYMFSDALAAKYVQIMFNLDPGYMSPFSDDTTPAQTPESTRPPTQRSGRRPGFPRQLKAARIFLAYNAKARDGPLFLNNTPRAPSSGKKKAMHANTLPGTHQCVTRHVKDVITCLGGIQVLLPLFAQVDLPTRRTQLVDAPARHVMKRRSSLEIQSPQQVSPGHSEVRMPRSPLLPSRALSSCEAELAEFSYEPDPEFFVNILRVFRVMLEHNPENQHWMLKNKSFSVIGVQLEKLSRLHFSLDALEALDKLSQTTAEDEKLLEDCFFGILARMKLWIYTPPEVQRRWLIMIDRIVTEHPFLLQRENGQLVWRSLQAVCWYDKPSDPQHAPMRLFHRITHAVIGQRPEIEMLECIRQTFLSLFQVVWYNGITPDEVGMLLTFLQACPDERQKIGVLQEVLWLMNNKATSSMFLRCLTDLGSEAPRPLEAPGFFVFLDLLSSPLSELRVLALRGIDRILRNPDGRLDVKTERILCMAVGDILKRVEHHLTEQTYFILCSIMSQKKIDLHNYEKKAPPQSETKGPAPENKSGDLRPDVLPIIFSLMPRTSADAHQNLFLETVLKNQLSYFDNLKYKSSIMDQPGWQTWFFDLMLARCHGEETPADSTVLPPGAFVLQSSVPLPDLEDDTVCVYARSFFVSVLFHALAKSFKAVERSLAVLATYVCPPGEERETGPVLSVEEPQETIVLNTNELGEGMPAAEGEEKSAMQSQSIEPIDPSELLDDRVPLPVLRVWLHVLEELYKLLVQQDKTSQYDMGTLVVNAKFLLEHSQDLLLSRVNAAVLDPEADPSALENVWPMVRVMNQIRKWVMENWDAWAPDIIPGPPLGNHSSSGFAQAFSGTLSRKPSKSLLRSHMESPGVRQKHSGPESLLYVAVRVLLVAFPIASTRVQGTSTGAQGISSAAHCLFNSKHTSVLIDLLSSFLESETDKLAAAYIYVVYTFLRLLCTMLCKLHQSNVPFGGVQVLPVSPSMSTASSEHLCLLIVEWLRVIHKIGEPQDVLESLDTEADGHWEEDSAKATEGQEEPRKNLAFELAQSDASVSHRMRRSSRGGPEELGTHRQRFDSASSVTDDMQRTMSISLHDGSLLETPGVKIPLTPFVLLQSPLRHPDTSSLSLQQWHTQCIEYLVNSTEWRTCRIELGQCTEKTANKQQKIQQDHIERFDKMVATQQTELLKTKRDKRRQCSMMQNYVKTVAKFHAQQEADAVEAYSEAQKKERQSSAALWRTFMRALTNERGPWSQYLDLPEDQRPQVYWKVDDCENHQRMRPKLKINYAGVDHREASQNIPEAREADSEEKTEQTLRELLGSISKSVVITDDQAGEQKQLGEIAEEETEEIESIELFNQDAQDEKELIKCDCTMVNPMNCIAGKIRVTTRYLYFDANPDHPPATGKYSQEKNEIREKLMSLLEQICETRYNVRWPLIEIRALHYRRYQLRQNAMELFFEDQNSAFFHFPTKEDRNSVHRILSTYVRALRKSKQSKLGLKPTKRHDEEYAFNYTYSESRPTGADLLRRSKLTQDWKQRKMSNFDYLMHLNTLAGRTYKDLTQYPVFPWVLSNYDTETIDLNDPNNYRDLSKPMGAQDECRLKMYIERYQSLDEDATMKKFHYGTHYSSAGTVLFFLIRIEPFTTLSIMLQDGKFDHPDRMFHSIPQTWRGCLTNPADVKELIPEWFYLPELFKNTNGLVLGSKQQGELIGDVVLPPWAKTPEEFVRINRAALESEHVSKNLHKWIDLIFGEKQKGPKAVEAHNVFFYLTYEGSVNIDSIENATLREATLSQIEHFGQTPSQLLTLPHPPRLLLEDLTTSIFTRFNELYLYRSEKVTLDAPPNDNPLLFIQHCHDRLVMVGLDRMVGLHKWRNSTPEYVPPFSFEVESGRANKRRRIGVHFAVGLHILPFFFAVSSCERYVFSCGHWDNSFRCSNLETGDLEASISTHKDIVTCMAMSLTGDILVTGSKDTTVMVWELDGGSYSNDSDEAECFISDKPKHILYGHDDEVTCVAVNRDLDMVASGSMDGSVIVHTIRKGEYCRSIKPPEEHPLRWVGISSTGNIVTYSLVDRMLHAYSINGDHIAEASASERLYALMFSENGEFLVTGGDRGVVQIRTTHNLKVAHRFNKAEGTIRSLACTPNEQHLLVGLQTGHVQIYALNATFLRKRFLRRLANLGF